MVKVIENYITEISNKDDFDDIGDEDELYIEAEDGTYHLQPRMTIQAETDGITFINWGEVKYYDYEDVYIYRVKNEKAYFSYDSDEILLFIWVIIFGIMILTIFFIVIGAI